MTFRLIEADCVEAMAAMDPASVDAIVTDPPYGLEFMGKEWDRLVDDRSAVRARRMQDWYLTWAVQALRVLKPGGHLLAFGGTRTFHRLTCALEDAGFEIRDCLSWLYGSGFPKSLNLDGEWQGWGTALKPAWEPVVLARKPLVGTVAANVLTHGTGVINVDGCRVGFRSAADEREAKDKNRHADFDSGPRENRVYGEDNRARGEDGNYDAPGRWPANVVLDETAAALLDEQSGERPGYRTQRHLTDSTAKSVFGISAGPERIGQAFDDTGGASRFFYTAKAGRAERERGVEHRSRKALLWSSGEQSPGTFQAEGTLREAANHHPTVKPVSLMQWLVRMVTPPHGTVLDPFTGSGSTGIAALREGFDFIGIEREHGYIEIARDRIVGDAPLFNEEVTAQQTDP